jgi:hypothetical protein
MDVWMDGRDGLKVTERRFLSEGGCKTGGRGTTEAVNPLHSACLSVYLSVCLSVCLSIFFLETTTWTIEPNKNQCFLLFQDFYFTSIPFNLFLSIDVQRVEKSWINIVKSEKRVAEELCSGDYH